MRSRTRHDKKLNRGNHISSKNEKYSRRVRTSGVTTASSSATVKFIRTKMKQLKSIVGVRVQLLKKFNAPRPPPPSKKRRRNVWREKKYEFLKFCYSVEDSPRQAKSFAPTSLPRKICAQNSGNSDLQPRIFCPRYGPAMVIFPRIKLIILSDVVLICYQIRQP